MNVVIVAPWSPGGPEQEWYYERCVADSQARGETPVAVPLLLAGALDDADEAQRALGMALGRGAISFWADAVAAYTDRGVSEGMKWDVAHAKLFGVPVIYRRPGEVQS